MARSALKVDPARGRTLLEEVAIRSGQKLQSCYQCRRCASGCPVGAESDTPDRLIRAIVLGDREAALGNLLVWRCVACYTCGTRCPNDIQSSRITAALKQISHEEHRAPLLPRVAAFHEAFVNEAGRAGRFNEIVGMGKYELKVAAAELKRAGVGAAFAELKAQAGLGMAMRKKKRMHVKVESVKGKGEIRALYRKAGR